MDFEWDESKNDINEKKHGIRFEDVVEIFEGSNPLIQEEDKRRDYREKRFVTTGIIENILVIIVIHTDRNGRLRIISARKANKREIKKYYENNKER